MGREEVDFVRCQIIPVNHQAAFDARQPAQIIEGAAATGNDVCFPDSEPFEKRDEFSRAAGQEFKLAARFGQVHRHRCPCCDRQINKIAEQIGMHAIGRVGSKTTHDARPARQVRASPL